MSDRQHSIGNTFSSCHEYQSIGVISRYYHAIITLFYGCYQHCDYAYIRFEMESDD